MHCARPVRWATERRGDSRADSLELESEQVEIARPLEGG